MESSFPRWDKPLRDLTGVAVVVALVVLGIVAVVHAVPNVVPKRAAVVDEGSIVRSGKLTPAATRSLVQQHEIRTIIDLGAWPEGSIEDRRAQRTAEALGVTRYRFNLIGDATGNINGYLQAIRLMTDPANQPVLIHCGAGTERTGATVGFYRQIFQGADLREAYAEACDAGHRPESSSHLYSILQRYTEPLRAAIELDLPSVPGHDPLPEPTPVTLEP